MMPIVQKTETRKGGLFEDVLRYWQQTLSHGAMRFVELALIIAALYFWARVAADYMDADPVTGRMADMMSVGLYAVSLIGFGYAAARAMQSERLSDDITTRSVIAGASLIMWLAFNGLVSPVIIYALHGIQSNIGYIVPFAVVVGAVAFYPSLEMGRYGFEQEVTRQTPFNSEGYWIKELEYQHQNDTRNSSAELAEALDKIAVLERELKAAHERKPDKVFVPFNHGGARAVGDAQLSENELLALSKYITGWRVRGTGRDPWTTAEGRAKFGGDGISDPQWRKFTALLKGLAILDSDNRPNVGRDEALRMLQLPPYPTAQAVNQQGDGKKPTNPTQPDHSGGLS